MSRAALIAKGQAMNANRVAWAGAALDAFVNESHTNEATIDELHPDDAKDAFADLLCNLRHFAKANSLDFGALDARAARSFDHESAADYRGD
jgi:hypothetical protein